MSKITLETNIAVNMLAVIPIISVTANPRMAPVPNWKRNMAAIIVVMFAHLSSKADGGIGPYRAILQSLMDWSHFDPYYFTELGKLNKEDAIRSIQHLKQLQEIRDHKIKEGKKEREQREQGGSPTLCTIYAYYYFLFEEDDGRLAELERECRSGNIICGDCKARLAKAVKRFLVDFQGKREKAKDVLEKFLIK